MALSILDIQNRALFYIACLSALSCIYYKLYYKTLDIDEVVIPFQLMLYIITVHAAVDTFFQKQTEMVIHHLLVLGLSVYYFYHLRVMTAKDVIALVYPCLRVEISSIFYILRYWLPKKSPLYMVNSIVFFLAFFKFRIFDFFCDLLIYTDFTTVSRTLTQNTSMYILLYTCAYGMYLLNLYWFIMMTKILIKLLSPVNPELPDKTSMNRKDLQIDASPHD